MKKTNTKTLLQDAIKIKDFIDKIPKMSGWTMSEYEQLKELLLKGFYANLENAKKYIDY